MEMHPGKGAQTWSSGDAVALSSTDLWVSSVIFQAKKITGDNTGNVHLGPSGLDQGATEVIELGDKDFYEPRIPTGARINLKDIYLDADTAGDGVTWLYWK